MGRRSRIVGNLRVGRPDVAPDLSSHVPGVMQANSPGNLEKNEGIRRHGLGARGTAARSTGINAEDRNPIDPRMPNLSPS
jgi:hypothetical protein